MKKRILMCIIASAVICGTVASCGKGSKSGSNSDNAVPTTTAADTTEADTTTAETTEADTTAATTAVETTEASTSEDATSEEGGSEEASDELIAEAAALLNNLNTIDYLGGGGGGVEIDTNSYKEEKDYTYFKVTDSRYTSVEDAKKFVTDNITGSLLDRYKSVYEGDAPSFKEIDGGLYFIQAGRGCGFEFLSDPVLSDIKDESFTITVKVDDFGATEKLIVKAVKEDGKWKASSFKFGDYDENVR